MALRQICRGFPGSSDGKEPACNVRDPGSSPGSGTSTEGGNGYPLQYSCLENPMDRGAWRAAVHGVTNVRQNWVTNTFTFANQTTFPVFVSPSIQKKLICIENLLFVVGKNFYIKLGCSHFYILKVQWRWQNSCFLLLFKESFAIKDKAPEPSLNCEIDQKNLMSSVQFSSSVVSNSLRPHKSQHTRPPCPSPTPGVYPN